MSDELRRLRDATKATPDAAARVKAATADTLGPAEVKALLRTLPAPPEGAAARIKANTAALAPVPPRPWLRAGAALVGAALIGVGALALLSRPEPPVALVVAEGQHVVVGDLALDARGAGALSGTRAAPVLDWEAGEVRLSAGDLLVRTREAEARLVEQGVVVTRDLYGTTIRAESSPVSVRCLAEGDTRDVSPGATVTCPPVSQEGMLARARAEHAAGAPAATVLATVDEALTRPAGLVDARGELSVLRMQVLVEDGRPVDALAEARRYLATGDTTRHDVVQRFAAALALTHEGCAGALPHLDALAPTSLDAALRLAACAPDRAARVLDAAAALAVTPEDREALATTRSQLGAN